MQDDVLLKGIRRAAVSVPDVCAQCVQCIGVYLPSDNVLTIAVEFGMANQYVRDLSVNIRRGIREKIRRGIWHGVAPLGYFNHPKLRTVEPNTETFPKLKLILEMFATGRYSLTAIQKE